MEIELTADAQPGPCTMLTRLPSKTGKWSEKGENGKRARTRDVRNGTRPCLWGKSIPLG